MSTFRGWREQHVSRGRGGQSTVHRRHGACPRRLGERGRSASRPRRHRVVGITRTGRRRSRRCPVECSNWKCLRFATAKRSRRERYAEQEKPSKPWGWRSRRCRRRTWRSCGARYVATGEPECRRRWRTITETLRWTSAVSRAFGAPGPWCGRRAVTEIVGIVSSPLLATQVQSISRLDLELIGD